MTLAFGGVMFASQLAHALSAEEVFRKASPSIVVVVAKDLSGTETSLGSGVAIDLHSIATNCHVLSTQSHFDILQGDKRYPAFLVAADTRRDLCILKGAGLSAIPAARNPLKQVSPGARAYAIGAPSGLELTISEGLVSGLRMIRGQPFVQTSAAISPGSSGGGLFDDQGRLIGITTMHLEEGQSLNFAIPSGALDLLIKQAATTKEAPDRKEMAASVKTRHSNTSGDFDSFASQTEAERWLAEMMRKLVAIKGSDQEKSDFLKTLHYESRRTGLDPQLVLSLIDVSSAFRKFAVGEAGAVGYMQVSPYWIKEIGSPDHHLFYLRTNLRYGCTILRYYLDTYHGNLYSALLRYRMQMLAKNSLDNEGLSQPETRYDTKFAEDVFKAWKTTWLYVNTSVGQGE